MFFELLLCAD
ncbi:rCG55689 [Rattus norvegicus]|uniref:RCG55689 n=1 Tax=Rattus norvegicus TaxID=10116 RepID=A6JQL5_RAT|nr:rCG55689 [Rattus norvegicus]